MGEMDIAYLRAGCKLWFWIYAHLETILAHSRLSTQEPNKISLFAVYFNPICEFVLNCVVSKMNYPCRTAPARYFH